MRTEPDQANIYFLLTAWCTVAKEWRELPGRYSSLGDAEQAATDRGIYRLTFVCEGQTSHLDPFARIGDD